MDIRFEQVGFTYQPNSPFEQRVLFDIDLAIKEGSYTALVGHTGSTWKNCRSARSRPSPAWPKARSRVICSAAATNCARYWNRASESPHEHQRQANAHRRDPLAGAGKGPP